jgi:two-component sensor histidine kinase
VRASNSALELRVIERTADLTKARDRAQVLLSEVNHRVANSLALVSSLITLQARAITDAAAKSALGETQDRIFAISLVHKRLYGSSDARAVTLDEYLTGLLDHIKTSMRGEGQSAALSYDLAPVQLATDASINLGIVVTEWVTNAFKYAYPAGTAGEIRVRLRQLPEGKAELVVEDDGVGRVEGAPAKGTGLGSRIVTAMAQNLGGAIEYTQRSPGMSARLIFAAEPLAEAQAQ